MTKNDTIHCDIAIIGAGIVGLASAYQLLQLKPYLKIIILEKENEPAKHQTGRNSGVVHTGIYYKPGSLKANYCTQGRKKLLEFCDSQGIAYRKIHKLIVATKENELPGLREIYLRGQANGVPGLKILNKELAREIEPHVLVHEAIYIPECHIIDYKQVAKSLCQWLQERGGDVRLNSYVETISKKNQKHEIVGSNFTLTANIVLNCAGLYTDRLAKPSSRKIEYQIIPFRGEYYELVPEKRNLVNGLIYPVPDPKFPFLGVHLTPMLNGKVEAGPNAILALAREGYKKTDINFRDLSDLLGFPGFWKMANRFWKEGCYEMIRSYSKRIFLRDLQRIVPAVDIHDLMPGGSGIRAQAVQRNGKLVDDFVFLQEEGIIHVLNAPSPAATASFSIGKTIAEMAIQKGRI